MQTGSVVDGRTGAGTAGRHGGRYHVRTPTTAAPCSRCPATAGHHRGVRRRGELARRGERHLPRPVREPRHLRPAGSTPRSARRTCRIWKPCTPSASRSLPSSGQDGGQDHRPVRAEVAGGHANDPAHATQVPRHLAGQARPTASSRSSSGCSACGLIAYLAQFEIGPCKAMEVFRAFGPGAMQAISANPYLLCGSRLQLDSPPRRQHRPVLPREGDCAQRWKPLSAHFAPTRATVSCLPAQAQLLETASTSSTSRRKAGPCAGQVHRDRRTLRGCSTRRALHLPAGPSGRRAGHCPPAGHSARRGKNTARDLDRNLQRWN